MSPTSLLHTTSETSCQRVDRDWILDDGRDQKDKWYLSCSARLLNGAE